MNTLDRETRHYYAARAPEYDAVYAKPERQADLRAIEAWLPGQFAGARVLEVACGTGYWTPFLSQAAAEIVALDASHETLAIARGRAMACPVRFMTGDAYALPREAGIFDAAFAGFWYSHIPVARQREFLTGLAAMLRPGARVVLLDNRYVEGSSTPQGERDAEGNTWQMRRLADGSTHRVLKNFPAEHELRAAIAGLGRDARFITWQHYWAFDYVV